MAVLVADDFWNHKRETAKKVRRRISTTMKWVVAQGFRNDNPAGEVLGAALPRNSKAVEHYAAVSHAEVANAIVVIRASSATISTKLALEFLILTACRSGEVRGAKWSEIDLDNNVWTVPADRTKTGKPHRVPLSTRGGSVLRGGRENHRCIGLGVPERPRPHDDRLDHEQTHARERRWRHAAWLSVELPDLGRGGDQHAA